MGLGGISIWQLLIVLAIVILLFGTKRLRNFGGDLGNAVKGFRSAMDDSDKEKSTPEIADADNDSIDSTAEKVSETAEKKG